MILVSWASWTGSGLALADLTQSKPIRLRVGTITTPPKPGPGGGHALARSEASVTGLWLIQFNGHFQPQFRAQLAAAGVQLIHFVPDDAFIARLDQVQVSAIQALPFVRWVGAYEPRHKIDPRLTRSLAHDPAAPLAIRVLLRQEYTGEELAVVALHLRAQTGFRTSSLGTLLSGRVEGRRLLELARSAAVLWIEPAPRLRLFDGVATRIVMGDSDPVGGMAELHKLGFDGRGVTVAVADSGLDSGEITDLHPDISGRVDAVFAYGGLLDASDEHGHGTHCAGIIGGNGATGEVDDHGFLWGLGIAPGVHLVGQRIFDAAGGFFAPPTFEQLTRDAVRSGAYVGSNSWGDDTGGQYDLSAAEFDALVRDADALTPGDQQYVLEFSAGNAGPAAQSVGSPAVAKNVIATGACQNNRFELILYAEGQEVMADFSSRGPCDDGRIKPDVVAPGTWIASLRSVFANDNNSWAPISDKYLYEGGTSQAGPHVSGAAAVFVQWYRETHAGITPSPALVKAGLINSADDMGTATIPDPTNTNPGDTTGNTVVGDTGPVPNADEGWGRINLVNLIHSSRRYQLTDQSTELSTDQTWEKRVVVGADDQFKVTLVYTDVPALPAAIPALVNDLDLEVVAPDGSLYRGNAIAQGESVAGTPEGDRINNVEAVHLSLPAAGEWLIRVRAHNVVSDIHHRTNGSPQQDFALVLSGALPLPGEGVISFDREAYRTPGAATVRLTDFDLASQPTATVHVSSSREVAGFDLVLSKTGTGTGSFIGSVNLANGTANAGDQILQVADGDDLTVTYHDVNPAGDRTAAAKIDLQPPAIAAVASHAAFGQISVTWTTGEPASSILIYGATNAVTNILSTLGFVNDHEVRLPRLSAETTYFYYVVSADPAGNRSTNTLPGGIFYRFIAPSPKTALLVYNTEHFFESLSDTPYPGIENWTTPLDTLGLDYEVWNVDANNGAAPTLAELSQYRLVLWRPEEFVAPAPGFLTALTKYVNAGGSFFSASFDLLSRLTEASNFAFQSNVLHVASFVADQGATGVKAVSGDPVGGHLDAVLDYSNFPSGTFIDLLGIVWETGPDHLQVLPDAAASLTQEGGRIVGLRYPRTGADSAGRVVFWSFSFEALPASGDGGNNRTEALARAVGFLVPDLQASSSVAFDQSAYTVPANVVVEVTDARRKADAKVPLLLDFGLNPPQSLTLSATPQKGVFRGRVTLIAPPQTNSLGRFLSTNGDLLKVTYTDAAGRALSESARVDTVKPVVSQVLTDPSYNEAIISWATDKLTDALVRYGESSGDDSFLTKTAYRAELAGAHEVQIVGLLPDKTYYFEVVSRDAAGNAGKDNAGGKYYTVRTLKPLKPPVRDDLEHGREGYAVFNHDGGTGSVIGDPGGDDSGLTSIGWDFGRPMNSLGVTAHSGTNCWGTDLFSEPTDFAISDLITPAVSLVGGNTATLSFWQNFDFTQTNDGGGDAGGFGGGDLVQTSQVDVSADNGATWTTVYTPDTESSDGWKQVEVDISHYVGSVVRFRFNYQLFSFNTVPRVGWLVDDLAVDVTTISSSRIVVSNNLAQARFTVTGSTNSVTGAGFVWSTNVAPGDYVVRWLDVAYYVTPIAQTNHLGDSTNALVFRGTYVFPDENHNGVSDLWEKQYFGGLSSQPSSSDQDGDGVSDLNEFLSGTNPNDPASVLAVGVPKEQANRTIKLSWPSVAGREYVLEGSQDLVIWAHYSDPRVSPGGVMSVNLPALDVRLPYFFRVTVRP